MSKINKENLFTNILQGTVTSKMMTIGLGEDICRMHLLQVFTNYLQPETLHIIEFDEFLLSPMFENSKTVIIEHRLNLQKSLIPIEFHDSFSMDVALVDSLDHFLIHFAPNDLDNFLKHMKRCFKRVIILFSNNMPTTPQLIHLRTHATTFVQMQRQQPFSCHTYNLQILHKRTNARIGFEVMEFDQKIRFNVSRNYDIDIVRDTDQDPDPETSDVPFLMCSGRRSADSSKEKEHVQPYTRAQGESKVFYIPDKNDDVDEEDPDDDLNF